MYFLVSIARLRELTEPDIQVFPGDKVVLVVLRHPASEDGETQVDVEVSGRRHGDRVGFDLEKPLFRVRVGGRVVASAECPSDEYDYYVSEALQMLDAMAELRAPLGA